MHRPQHFFDLFDLGVPLDILVYTPDEFAELRKSGSGFWKEFERNHIRIL